MTIVSEYAAFIIYSDFGKLFVISEDSPPTLPREVKEVFRVKFPESEQYSNTEILALCPEEYDYSGEPINESDYVFWKCVDEEPRDILKVSPALDEKYKEACALCRERHKAIYGGYLCDCAFRSFDNEYCSDIVTAERLSKQEFDISV